LSTITNLRNPTLKPRHWEEVETILETKFTPEEPLTLGRLVEIDAFDHAEELEEVAGKASSEYGLENILKRVS
jgi:dynein heavy chain